MLVVYETYTLSEKDFNSYFISAVLLSLKYIHIEYIRTSVINLKTTKPYCSIIQKYISVIDSSLKTDISV